MNDIKTACVDSRRAAIDGVLGNATDAQKQMVENFFKRLEEFASTCSDVTDFETKFATSPLAQEYAEIFQSIMTNGDETEEKSVGAEIRDEMIDDVTRYGRRQARQEAYDKARDLPVVGEALEVKQYADFFGRFRKKKDDE